MAIPVKPNSGLRRRAEQQGIAPLEALVAMLILAIGVVSMLGLQWYLLSEAHASTQRAQALAMIEDLSERIKSNPSRFAVLYSYELPNWDAPDTAAVPFCRTASCTPAQQASWDVHEWRSLLPQTIPGAMARSFVVEAGAQANQRELAVVLAWPDSRRASSAAFAVPAPVFLIAATAANAAIACPEQMQCHLAFVQP